MGELLSKARTNRQLTAATSISLSNAKVQSSHKRTQASGYVKRNTKKKIYARTTPKRSGVSVLAYSIVLLKRWCVGCANAALLLQGAI